MWTCGLYRRDGREHLNPWHRLPALDREVAKCEVFQYAIADNEQGKACRDPLCGPFDPLRWSGTISSHHIGRTYQLVEVGRDKRRARWLREPVMIRDEAAEEKGLCTRLRDVGLPLKYILVWVRPF